jgi:C1A family cysteine protease
MARKVEKYGWIPDIPDQRDYMYAAPVSVLRALPAKADLRGRCPPVYDQGELGSCTANAIGGAHQFEQMRRNRRKAFVPSRLFIYYNERVVINTVNEDSGAMLRDGMKSVAKEGVCPEPQWPYLIARFTRKPPRQCYVAALNHQVLSYRRLAQTLAQMKGCLASGYPFVFGFAVYDSLERPAVARTGIVPMPGRGESMLGGHAVMAVGYDDAVQRFIVRNSWGSRWGKDGYCFMPYAYLADGDLAADFWTIRIVEMMEE